MIELVVQVKCPGTVRIHRQNEDRVAVSRRRQHIAYNAVGHRITLGEQIRQKAGNVVHQAKRENGRIVRAGLDCHQTRQGARCTGGLIIRRGLAFTDAFGAVARLCRC